MNKKDKAIVIFYIFLAVSYTYYAVNADKPYGSLKLVTAQNKQVQEITLVKELDVNKTRLFDAFSDVTNYPLVLPENVASATILNQSGNVVYSEDVLEEKFVKTTVTVRHTIVPYQSQTMEVTSGDAKGTVAVLSFEGNGTHTTLRTDVKLHFTGVLAPFVLFPESILQDQLDQKIDEFAAYAKGFDNKYEKIVDDLYRKILYRPADPLGLQYFSTQLASGRMTISQIQDALSGSDEARHVLAPGQIKTVDELNSTTRDTINGLYQSILHRNADTEGMQYFGSELEAGKMTASDISKVLFNSPEGQNIDLTYHPARKEVSDLYMQIFHRPVDNQTLDHYVPLLQSRNMTYDQLEQELLVKNQSSSNP